MAKAEDTFTWTTTFAGKYEDCVAVNDVECGGHKDLLVIECPPLPPHQRSEYHATRLGDKAYSVRGTDCCFVRICLDYLLAFTADPQSSLLQWSLLMPCCLAHQSTVRGCCSLGADHEVVEAIAGAGDARASRSLCPNAILAFKLWLVSMYRRQSVSGFVHTTEFLWSASQAPPDRPSPAAQPAPRTAVGAVQISWAMLLTAQQRTASVACAVFMLILDGCCKCSDFLMNVWYVVDECTIDVE